MEAIKRQLEKKISKNFCIILDQGYSAIRIIPWQNAISLVYKDKATFLFYRQDGSRIRSQHIDIPRPLVVLSRFVEQKKYLKNANSIASKKQILLRDQYTCQYCGKNGNTVDHIIPKSKGGGHTWGNLVCSCKFHNQLKADKTPEEVGLMRPIVTAGSFNPYQDLLDLIYELLKETVYVSYVDLWGSIPTAE